MDTDSDILVLTHPYEFFDTDGRMEEKLEEAVENFAGDVAGVGTSRGKRDKGEPYCGKENYDLWFEDREGYGRLSGEDAEKVTEYGDIYLGGLGEIQCVGRTRSSIEKAGGEPEMRDDLVDESDIFEYLSPTNTV